MSMDSVEGRKFVVTGGTGSFGTTMVRHLLAHNAEEVRVFSRDESKQDNLRRELSDARVKFILGDTRDTSSMSTLFRGVDFVFHAAALKQVPSGEFFPREVVKTNIFGSANVIEMAQQNGVEAVVVLSTDKAVYPINAMGMSKALMEKIAIAEARKADSDEMRILVTRYGNVMMSRGSVIPSFLKSAREKGVVRVTHPEMTRFMMTLEDSVGLVKYALTSGSQGSTLVKKAPSATISTIVEAISIYLEKRIRIEEIGVRHGEKIHETLVSSEELSTSIDHEDFIEIPLDDRGLDYTKYFDQGHTSHLISSGFTSENSPKLSASELALLISRLEISNAGNP